MCIPHECTGEVAEVQFLHYQVKAGPTNIIQVTLDTQANVRLMDTLNYSKYRMKKSYDFVGGPVLKSPVDFRPTQKGDWHVVVDLEGFGGTVKASVMVLNC